jgi:hypothetical protein
MLGTWFLKGFGKRSEDATGANAEPFLVVVFWTGILKYRLL